MEKAFSVRAFWLTHDGKGKDIYVESEDLGVIENQFAGMQLDFEKSNHQGYYLSLYEGENQKVFVEYNLDLVLSHDLPDTDHLTPFSKNVFYLRVSSEDEDGHTFKADMKFSCVKQASEYYGIISTELVLKPYKEFTLDFLKFFKDTSIFHIRHSKTANGEFKIQTFPPTVDINLF